MLMKENGVFPESGELQMSIVSARYLLRQGLRAIIEPAFSRVLECSSLLHLKKEASRLGEDAIIVLEARRDTIAGDLEEVLSISARYRTVVLLDGEPDRHFARIIAIGARACLSLETPPDVMRTLLKAVESDHVIWPFASAPSGDRAGGGGAAGPASNRAAPRDQAAALRRLALLSAREKEVLALAAAGLGNKRIASAMGISDTTVRLHMRSIMRKTEVENRTQAVILAMDVGLS